MIPDHEKQAMLDKMVVEWLYDVLTMDRERFLALLDAQKRMFFARVWNCCDATGKKDHE